jgi:aminoglycoside phosphotransferase (APT) family kinase protein
MSAAVVAEALDLDAVREWLRAYNVPVVGPLAAEVILGGRSNLTFFLRDRTGRRWVLRRPPLGAVLPTAHDVRREFAVLSALAGTRVPVPRVIGQGTDAHGTDFYVMEEVFGIVVRDADDAAALDAAARAGSAAALAEGLAALHAVDPEEVGLGRLGRGQDYLARQIDAWQRQADQHRTADWPEADHVRDRLLADLPTQHETTLVHGDYRLDNALLTERGELAAVLDWELCTRGDPLVDLGVFLFYWTQDADGVAPFPRPATVLPGFPSRAEVLAHYVRASGREVPRLDYYLAYAAWRLAVVFEGVAHRSATGAYGTPDQVEEARLVAVAGHSVRHAGALLDRLDRGSDTSRGRA